MSNAPSGIEPLHGSARIVAAVCVAIGTFMQVLDRTVANVALPTIVGDLGVSAGQGVWVITTFAAANGISVPLTGWLMGRYGVVKTFCVAVVLFTLASVLCGAAWSLGSLILFRALQGACSGPLIPGSQVLLTAIFPPEQRTLALTVWLLTTLVAPICGPLIGGLIADNWSWPWIFFINVPIGLASAFGCWRYLRGRDTPTRKLPIDTVGFVLLVVWLGALQILLDQGKDADWFASPTIVALAIVTVLGLAAFLIWELTERHPIVDLSLFRMPSFSIGVLGYALSYSLLIAHTLLLPLWLQTRLGYTAFLAGLVLLPLGIVPMLLVVPSAKLMKRMGLRWTATASLCAIALSYYLRAGLTPAPSFSDLLLPIAVAGIGLTMFFSSMTMLALANVPAPRMPSGAGLLNFSGITAAAFAVSTFSTLWDRREVLHHARLTDHATAAGSAWNAALGLLQSSGVNPQASAALMDQALTDQAYALAYLDVSWLSAWITLILIPLIWIAPRGAGSPAASSGASPPVDH